MSAKEVELDAKEKSLMEKEGELSEREQAAAKRESHLQSEMEMMKTHDTHDDDISNIDKRTLIIETAFADEGPKLKRIRPRAQGRAYKILKPTCHITIVVKSIT